MAFGFRTSEFAFPLLSLLLLAAPAPSRAQTGIPAAINYQGTLTDNFGNAVTNGYYQVQFRIWDSPSLNGAGDYIWGRSYPLNVAVGGLFNILLTDDGGLVGTPAVTNLLSAFAGPSRYLGLTIIANPQGTIATPVEISPRQQLVSAPYAMQAQNATAAVNAGFATNASNASLATFAGFATNALRATTSGSASLATNALNLGSAGVAQEVGVYGTVRAFQADSQLWGGTDFENGGKTFVAPTDGFITLHAFNIWGSYSVTNTAGVQTHGAMLYCRGNEPGNVAVITLPLAKGESIHYEKDGNGNGFWNAWMRWRPFGR